MWAVTLSSRLRNIGFTRRSRPFVLLKTTLPTTIGASRAKVRKTRSAWVSGACSSSLYLRLTCLLQAHWYRKCKYHQARLLNQFIHCRDSSNQVANSLSVCFVLNILQASMRFWMHSLWKMAPGITTNVKLTSLFIGSSEKTSELQKVALYDRYRKECEQL